MDLERQRARQLEQEEAARRGYFGYQRHTRTTIEETRREELVSQLLHRADNHHEECTALNDMSIRAQRDGWVGRAELYARDAVEIRAAAEDLRERAERVRSGALVPDRIDVAGRDWQRINTDVGVMATAGVATDDESRLTGDDNPPPIDRTRRYGERGGLRVPLALHQRDLESAMPRDDRGTIMRQADPRTGTWFRLANDGGPAADPTRGINCVDGVLSLFDTYVHGRPRVSAPRTFDAYAHGDPSRPLDAEKDGLHRIEQTAGGEFQGLCPNINGFPPAAAREWVDNSFTSLESHLQTLGHGSFAFIITDTEGGAAHAWTAVNQHNTILYLDPQTGAVSENTPLYRNQGTPAEANVISVDALTVSPDGRYAPLPAHRAGLWSRSALQPTGPADPPTSSQTPFSDDIPESDRHDPPGVGYFTDLYSEHNPANTEKKFLNSLPPRQRSTLVRSVEDSTVVADAVQIDIERVLADLERAGSESRLELVDLEHRVKTAESLARGFRMEQPKRPSKLSDFVARQKDRVRFSIVVGTGPYSASVRSILDSLSVRGYEFGRFVNFWRGDGRHNGLNASLFSPDGFQFEIQFPTDVSRSCGKVTHRYYETIRLPSVMPIELQVDAYLRTVGENIRQRVAAALPDDLASLQVPTPIDTRFATWYFMSAYRQAQYQDWLDRHGLSLDEMIRRHGLDPDKELGQ